MKDGPLSYFERMNFKKGYIYLVDSERREQHSQMSCVIIVFLRRVSRTWDNYDVLMLLEGGIVLVKT